MTGKPYDCERGVSLIPQSIFRPAFIPHPSKHNRPRDSSIARPVVI